MDHSSVTAIDQQQQEEKPITEPASPSSASSSSTPSSPIPAIKLQRKCSSGWICSSNNSSITSPSVTKLRRGGRVKLKLRSWMAEPLVVKEGDTSLRLATDLRRHNWLELKLNQKQDGPNAESNGHSSTTINDSLPIVPLKIRILEKTSHAARLVEGHPITQPAIPEDHSSIAQNVKTEEASESTCSSKWPLKKRLIRSDNQVNPVTSPVVCPVVNPNVSPNVSPVNLKTISSETSIISNFIKSARGGMQTDVRLSPPAQRGPVIMRNVMPPTPPASSTPPEIMATETDQDKPLDLSRRCVVELPTTAFRPPTRKEDKAEVEIIAMTTSRLNQSIHPSIGIQPLRQRFTHNPAEIRRVQRHEEEVIAKSLQEYTIQPIPPIRPTETPFPDWSRNVTSGFRPYSGQRPPTSVTAPIPPTPAISIAPMNRPFVLPPLRPSPHHWKSFIAQQQRNVVIRPEVQLHPVGQAQPPTNVFVSGPRLFHPQQVTPATTKKPVSTTSHSTAALPPDWSLRTCVVCSRRADFRCAGCHGNAYCSTLCQARDWPNHSQLCQRNS